MCSLTKAARYTFVWVTLKGVTFFKTKMVGELLVVSKTLFECCIKSSKQANPCTAVMHP